MKLTDIKLPAYTKGEEIFNMTSHIVGAVIGLFVLIICVAVAAYRQNLYGVIASAIYGISFILLYTMSSIYHGLTHPYIKRLFRILDHCAIYFLIAGTYTPIALSALRHTNPQIGWLVLALEWGLAIVATLFTAINLKRFAIPAMICYLFMGWMIVFFYPYVIASLTFNGFLIMLIGGILYTAGAVIYGIGKRKKYMHNVFHMFVLFGSIAHFIGIVNFAI